MTPNKYTPIIDRSLNDGNQRVYKFDNGQGASVVRHSFSYGHEDGLYEVAVVKFDGDEFGLDYTTPITDDVLGHLSDDEVIELLDQIAALPKVKS